MKNQILPKLIIPIASFSLGLIMTSYQPAQAITLEFEGSVDSGPLFGEEYSGWFSFDESDVTGTGIPFVPEFISVSSLEMNFLNTNFTQDDDLPQAAFIADEFVGLSFNVNGATAGNINLSFSFVPNFTGLDNPYMTYDSSSFPTGEGEGGGSVTFTEKAPPKPVPEPSNIFGTLMVLGGISLYKKVNS